MKTSHASRHRTILITAVVTVIFTLLAGQREALTQEPAQRSNQLPELTTGVSLSPTIARGDAQSFRITMVAGQFVSVVIEPQGIDLAVKIFYPDGRLLAEVDRDRGEGQERIGAIAEVDGPYRVEVRSAANNGKSARYGLRINELHLANAQDRSLVDAQTTYAEAARARAQKPVNREEVIRKYLEAVGFFRAAGEHEGEATTLTNIGVVYNQLGERQKSLDYLNEALSLHKAVGNGRGQVRTLIYMGHASSGLLERQKALEYFKEAVRISQSIDDGPGEAWAMTDLGSMYSALGESDKALEAHNLSLARSKSINNRAMEARARSSIGALYSQLGDPMRALEYFKEALPVYRELGDQFWEALTLTNIGWAYNSMKEWQKALDYFTLSLPLHKLQDDRRWTEAMVLTSIGQAYNGLGKKQDALESLNQALTIHRSNDNRSWESQTLTSIGDLYLSMGQDKQALDYYKQSLNLSELVSSYQGQAGNLLRIARAERNLGNLSEARRRAEAGLEILELLRGRVNNQESRASLFSTQRDYFECYVDLLMRQAESAPANGHDAEALQASERAHARSLLDVLNEGRVDIRQGVEPQLLARERALQRKINDEELKRVRAQRSKTNQEEVQAIEKRLNELLTDYRIVQSEIRTRSPRYAALTRPEILTLDEIKRQVLDDKTMLLEYALGQEKSYLWVVTQSELKSFVLPKRSVIEATARRVHELLTVSHKTEARRAAELAIAEMGQMVLGPAADLLTKERIVIVADGALEYVPFGALPIPSAQKNRSSSRAFEFYEPLIARHEVVSLPSASVLAVSRRDQTRREPTYELAVLADAVFQSDDTRLSKGHGRAHVSATGNVDDSAKAQNPLMRSAAEVGGLNFSRLPFTRREADAIVARVGEVRSLKALDFAASRETVFDSKLSKYRIIHLATHALLNSQHPNLSGIVLSLYDEEGRPVDGFLRAHEIYNLKLNAELVVLSACRTAMGKEIKGEGLVGLTRGFMYAGTPTVVASLWDVRDEATAELMSRFYERMFRQRMRPAAALRDAQVSMWKEQRWTTPYYWAGFILQGEWK